MKKWFDIHNSKEIIKETTGINGLWKRHKVFDYSFIFKGFQPCGLAGRDGAGSSTWVSGFGLYPSLSKTRSCTAADKLVIPDPDQSYYQFRSAPMLL